MSGRSSVDSLLAGSRRTLIPRTVWKDRAVAKIIRTYFACYRRYKICPYDPSHAIHRTESVCRSPARASSDYSSRASRRPHRYGIFPLPPPSAPPPPPPRTDRIPALSMASPSLLLPNVTFRRRYVGGLFLSLPGTFNYNAFESRPNGRPDGSRGRGRSPVALLDGHSC